MTITIENVLAITAAFCVKPQVPAVSLLTPTAWLQ